MGETQLLIWCGGGKVIAHCRMLASAAVHEDRVRVGHVTGCEGTVPANSSETAGVQRRKNMYIVIR